jgi:hypothetical protein
MGSIAYIWVNEIGRESAKCGYDIRVKGGELYVW